MADKYLIVKWLISNTGVLRQISDIVSTWSDSLTLAAKLEIVYRIAQAILPIIESYPLFRANSVEPEEVDNEIATAQSFGIAPVLLLNVIVPIVAALIKAALTRENDT